jgi:two-component system response regulator GlrR
MEEKLGQAHMVAGTDTQVLITGESGTGKEMLARAIHKASSRRNQPVIAVNCGGLTEEQVCGPLFRTVEGGTLLLDEVAALPMPVQLQLLQVLKDSAAQPARDSAAAAVNNVRIISTTGQDLQALMASGQFRDDLYYRLNVVHIDLPPLSRRREDIPVLVAYFLAEISRQTGQRKIYAPEAIELLATSEWPGNVRQLENVVRQNCALAQTPIIPVELVQQSLGGTQAKLPSFDEARDEFTRSYLSQILQITGGNVSQAARLAKRNRTDFYKLLGRHQLVPDDFKER